MGSAGRWWTGVVPQTPLQAGPPLPEEGRRLQGLITANLVGMVSAVVVLPVLGLTVAPARTLWVDFGLLALGAAMLATGLFLLRRGRPAVAVLLMLGANWLVAIGGTYLTPFLQPIGLLSVMLPLMVTFMFLPRRLVAPVTIGAVVAATTVAALAEARHQLADQPEPWLAIILLLVFVPVVAGLIALGVAHGYQRVLEQAELLRDSRARVVAAADGARRRLERDLHDGAQQRLVTTSVRLALARRLLPTDPDRADQALADALAELHEALRDLRELAHGIYPPLLAERGLGPALAAATRRLAVPVDLRVTAAGRHPADVEAAVYFCCLEALQNAVKHAGAGRITLTVEAGSALVFTVTDDGRGYDPAVVTPGSGTANMADRVAAVGGRLDVLARPGTGAVVRGEIPLPAR